MKVKTIFSIIVYGFIFALLWLLDASLINYIVNLFENHDVKMIIKIVLWVITISPLVFISIILGNLVMLIFKN